MPLFSRYPASPGDIARSAAEILGAAVLVDALTESVRSQVASAGTSVDGSLREPVAATPKQVYGLADEIKGSARYCSGVLSLFADDVTTYDGGIDTLNAQWDAFPAVTEPSLAKAKDALLTRLQRDQGRLEQSLDEAAATVAGMLARGPNAGDIAALERQGVMPSESLLPDPSTDAPLVVEVGGKPIVLGSDVADHIQVIPSGNGLLIRVGHVGLNGTIAYREQQISTDCFSELVIRSGSGNDVIEVPPEVRLSITAMTGDGNDLYFGGGQPGVSAGSGGADQIFLGEGDDVAFGGAGDDVIDGGDGVDVIDGQDGADTIVGGAGFDTLYGGRDNDTLRGGSGTDYLEGGSGDDHLDGEDGADTLSGGRDDDILTGGGGDDAMFGGRGTDGYDGGDGVDRAFVESGESDANTASITIELTGSPGDQVIDLVQPSWMSDDAWNAWQERIDSDLELLRSTPSGREGLTALDEVSLDTDSSWGFWTGNDYRHIRIVPYGEDTFYAGGSVLEWLNTGGGLEGAKGNYASPPGGALDDDALVNAGGMHPRALDDRPPVASLYHELSHSYDQLGGGTPNGTFTEKLVDEDTGAVVQSGSGDLTEYSAVGQDSDGDGDYDPVPTDSGRSHPGALTENALRHDLGWDNREGYIFVPGPGQDLVIEYTDDNGDVVRVVVPD